MENLEDELLIAVQFLALNVIADDRWGKFSDNFAVAVFGMILYGYALKYSRILAFDPRVATPTVYYVLTQHAKCPKELASSILREAEKSAFDCYQPTY